MRLALVNPNTTQATTDMMVRVAAQEAGSNVTIEGVTAPFGAPLITSPKALDKAEEAVIALVSELGVYDAVIIAAFGDPGRAALREILDVPVTGIAEAAMAEAAAEDRRFAVATTTPALASRIAATARALGHRRFAGTWTTEGDPATVTADADRATAALSDAVAASVREGRAEAVVIGGGPLALAARALAVSAPVPLIEPIPAALRMTLKRLKENTCL